MRRKILYTVFLIVFFLDAKSQVKVKFELQDIPKRKDATSVYYIAGSFNSWKPNDTAFRFLKINEGKYILDKELAPGNYEFKTTRGSWTKVETGTNGNAIGNRRFTLQKDTVIKVVPLNWADEFEQLPPKHTTSIHVKLLDSAFEIPQLHTKRRIWVYLPPSYEKSKKRYRVLYMHDGQNLFDEFTGGYGEWKVDEILDEVIKNGGKECIVIGIDHGGADRLKEYNPYDSQYGKGMGKAYTDFLVHTLKPYIDQHYRTKPDFGNTAIAGSSMGGLISMYAIAQYPEVFGSAGIFSPAFWIGKQIEIDIKKAAKNLIHRKIYFVAGELESKTMVSHMKSVFKILNPTGANKSIKFVTKADGEHKESFWSREFLDFYKFIAH